MLREVDGKYGKILVSDKDRYVGRSFLEYGEFSEAEAEIFNFAVNSDSVVADIGANFGAHTLVFARKAKHVYAIEPQTPVYDALCKTIELNGLKNVTAINAAAGDAYGEIPCVNLDFEVENNFGGLELGGKSPADCTYQVPLIKFIAPVSFMKIDVEGMELGVLRGSRGMIMEYKPVIYVENDRKDQSPLLIDYLKEMGYFCYWHMTPLYNPGNVRGNPVNVFGDACSLNMLCLPEQVDVPGLLPVTTPLHPHCEYRQ